MMAINRAMKRSIGSASRIRREVVTRQGQFTAGYCSKCRILPFKGLYLYSDEPPGSLRTNIYPVPDLRNPFLGVHFTVKEDGHLKIDPTAIPAFWREQYCGFNSFKFREFVEVLFQEAGLMMSSNFDFKKLAIEELQKYSRPHLVRLASRLASGVHPENYTRWGEPGIRAQYSILSPESWRGILSSKVTNDQACAERRFIGLDLLASVCQLCGRPDSESH
jgi:L-2-hydroxyglutarate oxidase LhgO